MRTIASPADIAQELAQNARARRLDRRWTQSELAARSNVALDTLKKFERTGHISLPRLVRIAVALGCADEIDRLFRVGVPNSLDELLPKGRARGRTLPLGSRSDG
jgi:transcriptional regulator with XRE-family HTH domain